MGACINHLFSILWDKRSVINGSLSQIINFLLSMQWLSFTIISRLNAEIEEINSTLQKIGCEDTEIGGMTCGSGKLLSHPKRFTIFKHLFHLNIQKIPYSAKLYSTNLYHIKIWPFIYHSGSVWKYNEEQCRREGASQTGSHIGRNLFEASNFLHKDKTTRSSQKGRFEKKKKRSFIVYAFEYD